MAALKPFISDARLPATAGAAEVDARYPLSTVGAQVTRAAGAVTDIAGQALLAAVDAREQGQVTQAFADTQQKLDTLRLDLERDPDYANREAKFNQAARQLETEQVAALSPRATGAFKQRLAGLYAAQAHSVRAQARKDETDALRVSLDQNIDTMLESALASRNVVERNVKLGEIGDAIARARDTGVLTVAQAKAYHKSKLEKFDELTVSRVMHTAPGAALALLNDRAATPNLDPLRREQLKIQAQARSEQMSLLAKADARAEVASVIDAFGKGNFQPTNLEDARRKAAAFPELSKQVNGAEYVYRSAADFAAKDVPEQQRIIQSLRANEGEGRATPVDTSLRDAYEKISANVVKAFAADPMATAMQRNGAASEAYAAAQRANDPVALTAATGELLDTQRRNGVPEHALRVLPKSVAEDTAARVNAIADPAAKVQMLSDLAQRYGPYWKAAAAQLKIDDKQQSPARQATASLALVAGTDPALARTIAEGRAARAADKHYAPTDDKGLRTEFDDRIGPAFKAMHGARALYVQEITDIYAKLAKDAGDTTGTLDTDRLAQAMKLRLGGDLVRTGGYWRGVKALPPAPGVDQSGFNAWLGSLSEDDLGGKAPILPASGRRVNAAVIGRNGFLYAIGDGRYRVEIDGEMLADPRTGRPFVLDYAEWKRRQDALDARRGSYR